jgi:ATP-dependent RNA helicase RhlE
LTFEQFGLIEPILKALKTEGYKTPTPIQERAIPVVLERKDLLGCAQTGTGKTAAFAIPILQILFNEGAGRKGFKHIRTLVLTPTRELATQINESFASYGKHTGLKHDVIFGGVSQYTQTAALRNGTDILIATPGRLLDLMNQGYIHLDHLELFVLDEADRMLDMGFIHDVKKIIKALPVQKQTLFFSATMPKEIAGLAHSILYNPVKIEVTPPATTVEKINQSIFFVHKNDKQSLLMHLIKENRINRSLVFTRTKHGADKIAKYLNIGNVKADALHGNKSQSQRERALNNFKTGRLNVLVATDIAARGIDVDELTHVINFDLPNVPETYVHRIGRTGRAGANGTALSFCDAEEKAYLRDIHKLIAQVIPVAEEHPFKMIGNGIAQPRSMAQRPPSSYRPANRPFNRERKAYSGNRNN